MKRLALSLLLVGAAGCAAGGPAPGAGPVSVAAETGPAPEAAERSDTVLQRELDRLVQGFAGAVGVYVRHLPSGRSAAVRADELFPTASMVKVPILLATWDAFERGALDPRGPLVYTDSLRYDDEDLLARFRNGTAVTPLQLVMLMLTMSDNTASLWLQHLAGSGTAINAWLAAHGFDSTRVNSRTPGRRADWQRYGWGQTTPREMAELLVRIRQGRAVSPAADEEMYRALSRSYWNGEALSAIPPWVQAASKQGAVDRSRSEVLLVNAPSGDYVLAIITKEQADESWEAGNAGWVLIRRISGAVWNHFEPAHRYAPPAEARRYKP